MLASSQRHARAADFPSRKDDQGRNLCRWCQKPVAPPKRSWCGQKCIDEYLIRKDAGLVRRKVWERDQGKCQRCDRDVAALIDSLDLILGWKNSHPYVPAELREIRIRWLGLMDAPTVFMNLGFKRVGDSLVDVIRYGGRWNKPKPGYWWQADHIKAVVEGGGMCGLDNYRLLCTPCHLYVTAEMRRRRAREQRSRGQRELFA